MEERERIGGGDLDRIPWTILPKKIQLALVEKLALILHVVVGIINKRMVLKEYA